MFNNIGKKIKLLAKFGCWVGIICCVIAGIIFLAFVGEDWWWIIPGLLTLLLGPILMWIGSWLLYSWGDLVDNVQALKIERCGEEGPCKKAEKSTPNEKQQKLQDLLSSGLITLEEYNKALEKEELC